MVVDFQNCEFILMKELSEFGFDELQQGFVIFLCALDVNVKICVVNIFRE